MPRPPGFSKPTTAAKMWWFAARPYSFTASVIPVLLGSAVAAMQMSKDEHFRWGMMILCVVGTVLAQAGTNLLNDYTDYKKGLDVDPPDAAPGGSWVLPLGWMRPEQIKRGSIVSFALASIIGAVLVLMSPPEAQMWILGIAGFGLLSGIAYTGLPVALKYQALGDVQVMLSMGFGITLGAFILQAHHFDVMPLLYAVPIALLIDAILHGNNLRDIDVDRRAGVATLVTLIGGRAAQFYMYFLVGGAYVFTIAMVATRAFPVPLLAVVLSAPLAMKVLRTTAAWPNIPPHDAAMFPPTLGQFNTAFGALMVIGMVIALFMH